MKRECKTVLILILVCIVMCLPLVGCKDNARTYVDEFRPYAQKYEIEVSWYLAVTRQESGFDKNAVSSAGAKGLMQLLPSTAEWIADLMGWEYQEDMLFDPAYNIRMGTWYIYYLSSKFDGDWWIAAYNAGEWRVTQWLSDGIAIEDIPFEETRNYIKKVKNYQRQYASLGYDK